MPDRSLPQELLRLRRPRLGFLPSPLVPDPRRANRREVHAALHPARRVRDHETVPADGFDHDAREFPPGFQRQSAQGRSIQAIVGVELKGVSWS
eukprot:30997-Pelagococcus_subviridis.AAC.1